MQSTPPRSHDGRWRRRSPYRDTQGGAAPVVSARLQSREVRMAAVDDLTELVEASAAAERLALASKWKERPDVEKLVARTRRKAADQLEVLGRPSDPLLLSSRWVSLKAHYLNLGLQEQLPE